MTTQFDLSSPAVRSNLARVDGNLVLIRSVNGGWTTIVTAAGVESKQRNKAVTRLTEAEVAALTPKAPAQPTAARKARNSQFQKGQSVYACRVCGRNTRQTGNGDNEHVELCEDCYEMAGLHNRVQDGGVLTEAEMQECRNRCAFVVSKGGAPDADHAAMCGFVAAEHKINSTVRPEYKKSMHKERLTLADGRKKVAQDCNDAVAAKLRTMNLEAVYDLTAEALTTFKHKKVSKSGVQDAADDIRAELKGMYEHLNFGLQRMNLGNLYRTATKATA
jgi:hypothetical protein